MKDSELLAVLVDAAAAVRISVDRMSREERRFPGNRAGQYALDLVADAAALEVLHAAGLTVFSEESGRTDPPGGPSEREGGILVVLDPVDGSTNASLGIPWYSFSACVLDVSGPRVSLVENLALGVRYEARRGGGSRRDGKVISPSGRPDLDGAIIGFSGYPQSKGAWRQVRILGSAALDLCLVAEGALDGYSTGGGSSTLNGWDYLGGLLICREARASVEESEGRDLIVRDATTRKPVAGATASLCAQLATTLP